MFIKCTYVRQINVVVQFQFYNSNGIWWFFGHLLGIVESQILGSMIPSMIWAKNAYRDLYFGNICMYFSTKHIMIHSVYNEPYQLYVWEAAID